MEVAHGSGPATWKWPAAGHPAPEAPKTQHAPVQGACTHTNGSPLWDNTGPLGSGPWKWPGHLEVARATAALNIQIAVDHCIYNA